MQPLLSHFENFDGMSFWVTTDNRVGVGFKILPIDMEGEDCEARIEQLTHFLRHLDPKVLGRIQLSSDESKEPIANTARAIASGEIGHIRKTVRLFVEVIGEPVIIQKLRWLIKKPETQRSVAALKRIFESAKLIGLGPKFLSQEEASEVFAIRPLVKAPSSIQDGESHLGIVRMNKQSPSPISLEKVTKAFEDLPVPHEIHVSFRKPDPTRTRLHLERRLKQTRASSNVTANIEELAAAEAISSGIERGVEMMEFELIVSLRRRSEESLREGLCEAATALLKIGGFSIETFGVGPSYLATLPGNSQHVPLLETDEYLPILLPIFASGEASNGLATARSLPLLRQDRTVFNFDLFNKDYNVANTLIVGTSGKGKSVLTGLLTEALLNDPKIKVIKIDVGGSHTKECELFGGQQVDLQLNKPSGLNPMAVANDERLSEAERIGILSNFLLTLITEQGEVLLSKDLRSNVEEQVSRYIKVAKECALQEFFDLQKKFPRRNLLARWVSGGLYEAAFAQANEVLKPSDSRLTYYNFQHCFQASDPEFAQAGFAALLAQFNHEFLVNKDERIVLICDEVPFFIKSCFQSLKFATANVRKFGHAVIQVAQLSTDFIVKGDTGLIENSPQRFFFSIDGNREDFQSRFQLSDEQTQSLSSVQSVPGRFSECLFQDSKAAKKLRIEITREEFWRLTSSKQDALKLQQLRAAVPQLSLKESIRCLSAL